MTKAAELAKMGEVLTNSQIGGRRNIIINGAMQVAQRGTSFTSISSITYPVDRFIVHDVAGASGEATVSQSTTAPTNFKNSLKIDVTTADTSLAAGDQYKIEYRIEGQDIAHLNFGTSSAQTITLSFYIRSNKTGNTSVALVNSANNRAYVAPFTIDSANTFERKEITIEGDQSGTWLDTNGIGLRLRWGSYGSSTQTSSVNQWQANQVMSTDDSPINFFDSTDNELYLTGVQLEVGEQATPFEHRSYGEELALCQRFFCELVSGTGKSFAMGAYYSSTLITSDIRFPVTMRATPTISFATGTNYYVAYGGNQADTFNTFTNTPRGSVNGIVLDCDSNGVSGTQGNGCNVSTNNASAYIHASAEL